MRLTHLLAAGAVPAMSVALAVHHGHHTTTLLTITRPTPTPSGSPTPSGTPTPSHSPTPSSSAIPSGTPTPSNMPGVAPNCDEIYKVQSGDTCSTIANEHGISIDQLKEWNSKLNKDCTNLWLDFNICVHVPGATTTSATPTPTPTPPPANGGPTPQQPGTSDECKSFHMVEAGDTCESIYSAAAISEDEFRDWNSEINEDCTNLWAGFYVCTGLEEN